MVDVLGWIKKLVVWLPLVAGLSELVGVGYFWLVQYELNVTLGPVGMATTDTSRTQLWPTVLVSMTILSIGLSFWLWRKQKSARPLSSMALIAWIAVSYVVPLMVFGVAAGVQIAQSLKAWR